MESSIGVYNPYAKPVAVTPGNTVSQQEEKPPPDVVKMLSRNFWLIPSDLEDIRTSIELAVLESEFKFKFKHSGGWGEWPDGEVKKARTVFRAWQTLLAKYKYQADQGKREQARIEQKAALAKAIPAPPDSEQAKEKALQDAVMSDMFG